MLAAILQKNLVVSLDFQHCDQLRMLFTRFNYVLSIAGYPHATMD